MWCCWRASSRVCCGIADAEGTQRWELGRAGRPTRELPVAEGTHEQDVQTEFRQQRQNGALNPALGRVVGHLAGVDAAGGHEPGELAEGDAE